MVPWYHSCKWEAKLLIRMARAADVPALLDIYRPFIETTAYTFDYDVPTAAEFAARFNSITRFFPWLVFEEDDGAVTGYAYADRAFARAAYQWDADLSIYLAPRAQGRGIGRQFYEILEDLLRRQGFFLAYGIVTSANAPSCAFHEALGYRAAARFDRCGYKFGRWYGTIWYEKRLLPGDPAGAPIPFQALTGLPEHW